MVSSKDIYSLRLGKPLSNRSAKRIAKAGYSRIPIYAKADKNFIVGILLIKSLIGLKLDDEGTTTIEDLIKDEKVTLRKPIFTHPDEEIGPLLMKFKNGRSHIAIITEEPELMEKNMNKLYEDDSLIFEEQDQSKQQMEKRPKIIGIVTIEDILEAILNAEIYDEADYDKQNNPNIVKLEISMDQASSTEQMNIVTPLKNDNMGIAAKVKQRMEELLLGKQTGPEGRMSKSILVQRKLQIDSRISSQMILGRNADDLRSRLLPVPS